MISYVSKGVDLVQIESYLRKIADSIQPFIGNFTRAPPAKAWVLLQSGTLRQALTDAGALAQSCLKSCDLSNSNREHHTPVYDDSAAESHDEKVQKEEEEEEEEQARSELVAILESLVESSALLEDPERIVLAMIQTDFNVDIGAIMDGRTGSRKHRRAVKHLMSKLIRMFVTTGVDRDEITTIDEAASKGTWCKGDAVEVQVELQRRSIKSLKQQRAIICEIEEWRKLEHPNIVGLFGACMLDTGLSLVVEPTDVALSALLRSDRDDFPAISDEEKLAILRGVTRGLVYLHGEGVVHGALRPRNVMLNRDLGAVKLTGFGGSRRTEDEIDDPTTLIYKAPEILLAPHRWNSQVDVYAMGMLMWEIYHGDRPVLSNGDPPSGDLTMRIVRGERPTIADGARFGDHHVTRELVQGSSVTSLLGKELEACKLIVNVIRAHPENPDLLTEAFGAIQNLTFENLSNRIVFHDDFSLGVDIIEGMRFHMGNADVLENACCVVWNLSANTRIAKQIGADLGIGIEVIMAMNGHLMNSALQESACSALWNLLHDEISEERLFNAGAARSILAAMHAHRDKGGVQEAACGALYCFKLRRELVSMQLEHAILAAMEFHPQNERLQSFACDLVLRYYRTFLTTDCPRPLGLGLAVKRAHEQFRGDYFIARAERLLSAEIPRDCRE
ncbi:Protein kinase, putative [Hondaea fermentalgiana]|uniref:Protein kinase, putative n=1 Tax=Hondaea fermentalgiana TaxID=2315210 RepID=A0A2R5G9H5_9STRA|nr:Protein kinase, putative [Hondaea fermentalgiana]|eukprot:GBG27687.1 Protein kinase, putative [Hondaea fermentalgiana]